MDPNEALKRMREIAALLIRLRCMTQAEWEQELAVRQDLKTELEELADELAQLTVDIDGWLNKGGSLPERWSAAGPTGWSPR